MDGWWDGWMDDGEMDGWQMDGQQMDGWMDRCRDGWKDESFIFISCLETLFRSNLDPCLNKMALN